MASPQTAQSGFGIGALSVMTNPTLRNYRIPTYADAPRTEVILVESTDSAGPMRSKGIAEMCINPVAPAIANAVRDLNLTIGAKQTTILFRLAVEHDDVVRSSLVDGDDDSGASLLQVLSHFHTLVVSPDGAVCPSAAKPPIAARTRIRGLVLRALTIDEYARLILSLSHSDCSCGQHQKSSPFHDARPPAIVTVPIAVIGRQLPKSGSVFLGK